MSSTSLAHTARRLALGLALLLCGGLAWGSEWHQFRGPAEGSPEAVGRYSNGCLIGGAALPDAGPGYQAIRLARSRSYAHPTLVDYIQRLGRRVADRGLGIMLVADLAMPRGGRFRSGHRSHQSGLDADIWLRLDVPPLPASRRQAYDAVPAALFVDRKRWVVTPSFRWKHAELLRLAALDERVKRIFVNPAIKKDLCERRWELDRSWLRKLRPWWGHDAHFHVRLACPPGSRDCADQPPPPPGEGCGDEVESWLTDLRRPPKSPSPPGPEIEPPPPPLRCQALLETG